jgi:hypothetical protein
MIDFRKMTISATDAVKLALGPSEFFFEPQVPKEVLEENKRIHALYGCEEREEVEFRLGQWTIRGKPDFLDTQKVAELKVVRPFSDKMRLLRTAIYQALIYARAVGASTVEVWLHNWLRGDADIWVYSVDELNAFDFFTTLEANLNRLASLRTFKPPADIFYKPVERKIAKPIPSDPIPAHSPDRGASQ